MDSTRRAAIAAGTLFILATAAVMVAGALDGTVDNSRYLQAVGDHADRQAVGGLFYLVAAGASVGIAIALYPVLRTLGATLALGSVVFRTIEAALYTIAAVSLMAIVPLGEEFVTSSTSDQVPLQAIGDTLLSISDHAQLAGVMAFSVGALLYSVLFFQSRLVPRWLAGWGVVGTLLIFIACVTALVSDQPVTGYTLLILPILVQELVMAGWLLFKGFKPLPSASAART